MFIIGLISGVLLAMLVAFIIIPKVLFIENESQYDFKQTATRITSEISANGWAMPHQYDLQMTMKKHGFEVRPVTVFSICHPGLAHQILERNKERIVASMMPCRIAIYQKADGKTYVSRMNTGLMSKLMEGKIREVMTTAGKGSERILNPIIKD